MRHSNELSEHDLDSPSTCPAPGFAANSLGTINLKTGAVGKVAVTGPVAPKGLIFVP
jgi:hypothetical protein